MTMPSSPTDFLTQFQDIFTRNGFRGVDFRTHLARPSNQRSGDEASIVDRAIVGPLLDLLGFPPGDQNYNVQQRGDRPDYAPRADGYGTCFVVESKNTTRAIPGALTDPESPLSQLHRYMRLTTVTLGMLTNGKRLMLYERSSAGLHQILNLDIEALLTIWASSSPVLPPALADQVATIERLCHRDAFTEPNRIAAELAVDLATWEERALRLGTEAQHEIQLVEDVQRLIVQLHADALQRLTVHLRRSDEYRTKRRFVDDTETDEADQKLTALRTAVMQAATNVRSMVGFTGEHLRELELMLTVVATETSTFRSKKGVVEAVLGIINAARATKQARPITSLDALTNIREALNAYLDKVGVYLKRLADLRQTYRDTRLVMEDFEAWRSLIQETVLGHETEEAQASEFALQAAYVVFIRLLLIRVCEDKGLFPHRFVSDGGIKHWQEDIERYLKFANGNPYTPLLDMAYANAQNIYAHFFTGREVFNWYRLDEPQLLIALHRLSRYNFADVTSDIVGTIYNTYVDRKAKKEKGQYYTPSEIVHYMLDRVGYTPGAEIIGPNRRLIDPACGSGSFLVTAAQRLVAAYRAQISDDDPLPILEHVRESLYGFDLNPFACYLAEVNLLIQVLDLVKLAFDRNQRVRLERFHIYNEDALASPSAMFSYGRSQVGLAEESAEADQIKRRAPGTKYANGFAYVVANPPYGAKISDDYKATLRESWSEVFYGQPDTYVFFFALAVKLLSSRGRMAFITPNTYLMGRNSALLRRLLLATGRIDEIVDLPQGIWPDANVDCAIIVLTREPDEAVRKAHQPHVRLMGLRDTLDKLASGDWRETLIQLQERWMTDPKAEINIRYDDLIKRIEDACQVSSNGRTMINRLGDVTDSAQGIIPYETRAQSRANVHIKTRMEVPPGDPTWHPLLDTHSSIGRYSLRWGAKQHYLHYGEWLCRPREERFFASPKLLLVRLRNKALARRLIATFDETGYYNRDNFNNIITRESAGHDLKYILALFNSSLLNYWYRRQFDNVNINPDTIRQIPIFPADAATQAEIVALVDQMLAEHAALNQLREQGYRIRRHGSQDSIDIPFHSILAELQADNPAFTPFTFYQARARGVIHVPDEADTTATISRNVFVPARHPESVVLRHNVLWLHVPDADLRTYLVNYLSHSRWYGQKWEDVQREALIPVETDDRAAFFAAVDAKRTEIVQHLDRIAQIDQEIDQRVLALYGITNTAEQNRVLGSAPTDDETETDQHEEKPGEPDA